MLRAAVLAVAFSVLVWSGTIRASEAEGSAALAVVGVSLEPGMLRRDTLCRLSLDLRNEGERPASYLTFRVAVEGSEIPIYERRVFLDELRPGETTTIRLPSFWTNETGREPPEDGMLDVSVVLTGASWMSVAADGTRSPESAVEGLPVEGSVSAAFSD